MGSVDFLETRSEADHCIAGVTGELGSSKIVGPQGGAEEFCHMFFERENRQSIQHLCVVEMDEHQVSTHFIDHRTF